MIHHQDLPPIFAGLALAAHMIHAKPVQKEAPAECVKNTIVANGNEGTAYLSMLRRKKRQSSRSGPSSPGSITWVCRISHAERIVWLRL